MAVLDITQRQSLRDAVMRTSDCPGAITKPQLAAVVGALDDWWETSGAAAANTAIPQPQRGILTAKQKARLFMALLEVKYEGTV